MNTFRIGIVVLLGVILTNTYLMHAYLTSRAHAHTLHIPQKNLSQMSNISAKRQDSIWFSVTVLARSNFSTYTQRQSNVEAIRRYIPQINILKGSRGLDEFSISNSGAF
mgnify:CR=1 FL=1